MTERRPNRPTPKSEHKQSPLEVERGSFGFRSPNPEHSPQDEASKSQKRQPLPNVWNVLERLAQHDEDSETATARLGRYMTRARRAWDIESRDKASEINKELHAVRALGTDYDRFILDVYTTLSKSSPSLGLVRGRALMAEETRQFIARARSMSEDEFREEIRKDQEEAQEARKRAQEARFKNTPWYKQYEQRKLQEEQRQSTQDPPSPTKK